MKKIIVLILSLAVGISFAACTEKTDNSGEGFRSILDSETNILTNDFASLIIKVPQEDWRLYGDEEAAREFAIDFDNTQNFSTDDNYMGKMLDVYMGVDGLVTRLKVEIENLDISGRTDMTAGEYLENVDEWNFTDEDKYEIIEGGTIAIDGNEYNYLMSEIDTGSKPLRLTYFARKIDSYIVFIEFKSWGLFYPEMVAERFFNNVEDPVIEYESGKYFQT